jgi:hypothetical protein
MRSDVLYRIVEFTGSIVVATGETAEGGRQYHFVVKTPGCVFLGRDHITSFSTRFATYVSPVVHYVREAKRTEYRRPADFDQMIERMADEHFADRMHCERDEEYEAEESLRMDVGMGFLEHVVRVPAYPELKENLCVPPLLEADCDRVEHDEWTFTNERKLDLVVRACEGTTLDVLRMLVCFILVRCWEQTCGGEAQPDAFEITFGEDSGILALGSDAHYTLVVVSTAATAAAAATTH